MPNTGLFSFRLSFFLCVPCKTPFPFIALPHTATAETLSAFETVFLGKAGGGARGPYALCQLGAALASAKESDRHSAYKKALIAKPVRCMLACERFRRGSSALFDILSCIAIKAVST